MRLRIICFLTLFFSCLHGVTVFAQGETGPLKIKINRIVYNRGNTYAFYVPSLEFHVFFQQEFNVLRSAITADYDYRRQDMGFGMSHALYKYIITPGITVEDNLYFREVFTDSTGIWNRSQSIIPFIIHEIDEHATVGMEFTIQREWSPKRRMGAQIINSQDRSLKIYYLYKTVRESQYNQFLGYTSFERAYQIFNGDFNYLLLEVFLRHSREINKHIRIKNIVNFKGNITPQTSPLIFLGGHSSMIGFDNDEFWGRRVFYLQNLFEIKPLPRYEFSIKKAKFRRLALLLQFDIGQVRGAPVFLDLKPQNMDIKMGVGVGIGVNTDLPYMPKTDLHIMVASPSDRSDIKFYAGFGGWIN